MNGLVHPSPNDLFNNTPFYPAGTPQPGSAGPDGLHDLPRPDITFRAK